MNQSNTIKIDDVTYIREDAVQQKPAGNRAVVVVDRGWIFAGDVTLQPDFCDKNCTWRDHHPDCEKAELQPVQEPDVPFPGMATAFEAHYGQRWTDPDWRKEAATWAAAWKAALSHNAVGQQEAR